MDSVSRTAAPQPAPEPETLAAGADPLACLGPIIEDLSSSLELDEVLQRLTERCRQNIGYDAFAILLLDDTGKQLRFRIAAGFPTELVAGGGLDPSAGPIGDALRTGRSVLVPCAIDTRPCACANGAVESELVVPLRFKGRAIGVLDLRSCQPQHYQPFHQRWLEFLAPPLANAIENARLFTSLRDQSNSLGVLNELGRQFASILDREQLLRTVAESVKRLIDYQIFHLMLWNPERRLLEHALSIRFDQRMCDKGGIPLGVGITGSAAALRTPVRVANVDLDPRYVSCGHEVPIRSELAIPLEAEGRLIGVIDMESTEYDAFSEQHEQMLQTLASSIAIAFENTRLYAELGRRERLLEEDLETARDIQEGLLPKATPYIPGLEAAFAYLPARELGGDFYDVLPYGDPKTAIAIGDVAGKGTAAALYGSLAVGLMRGRAIERHWRPTEMLELLNEQLRQTDVKDRFLAMAFAVFDPEPGELTIAVGGFPRPLLVRAGGIEPIAVEGIALGVMAGATYRATTVRLQPGDTVVFASDGFEEAMDSSDRQLGTAAVHELLRGMSDRRPQDIVEGLIAASDRHAAGAPAHDDRTAVVLRLSR